MVIPALEGWKANSAAHLSHSSQPSAHAARSASCRQVTCLADCQGSQELPALPGEGLVLCAAISASLCNSCVLEFLPDAGSTQLLAGVVAVAAGQAVSWWHLQLERGKK